ncbi:MAG: SCO family protein [Magnetococcales bacterium]|nr:SCO family protein [Magnetococcales bacterium]
MATSEKAAFENGGGGRKKVIFGIFLIGLNLAWLFVLALPVFNGDGDGFLTTNRRIQAPFLDRSPHAGEVVYFGFVGCDVACPVALNALARAYEPFSGENPTASVGVTFVNLAANHHPELNDMADSYAKAFHPDFRGVDLPPMELKQMARQFGVYATPSLADPYQVGHGGFIYFLRRAASQWAFVSTYLVYPPQSEALLGAMKSL